MERARTISSRLSGAAPVKPAADPTHSQPATRHSNAQLFTTDPQALAGLRDKFMDLHSMTPQECGFAFERFLNELFNLFHLAPRGSFRLVGEQIDGSFQIGQDVSLVEAKWQNQKTGQSDLLSFS